MFINRKFQTFIFTTLLISTQSVLAKATDIERINTIAQGLITAFSGEPNQELSSIKMTAAMEGVSESEIQKRFDESHSKPQSMSDRMFDLIKQQYNAKDLKVIIPAFQKQMSVQGVIYNSCKLSGNPIKSKQTYEVPLICNVPEINFEGIQVPKKSTKESDAQYMAKLMNLSSDQIAKAPTKMFNTKILIHKQDDQLIPEMDNPSYFPSAVNNKMTGTTEEELMLEKPKN